MTKVIISLEFLHLWSPVFQTYERVNDWVWTEIPRSWTLCGDTLRWFLLNLQVFNFLGYMNNVFAFFIMSWHWGIFWFQHQLSLTHWGWVTQICACNQTIIASDNGLSLGQRQAIIWTNARILLIRPLGINFSEILIEIHAFSFNKTHLKMSSVKQLPFCLSLNVLKTCW